MKVKNLNSSSRKTRALIKQVFAELIAEKKDLSNISVTELAKRADITRSSFYTHYDSLYDVAQELQNETFDILIESLEKINSIEDVDIFFDEIVEYLKENEKIYSLILASNDPTIFIDRLKFLLNKVIIEDLKNTNNENYVLNAAFFIDGCMDLVVKSFRKEINYNLDELNVFFKDIFKKIFL